MRAAQLQAIVFYEMQLLWRRRVLPALMLLAVLLLVMTSYSLIQQARSMTVPGESSTELAALGVTEEGMTRYLNTTLIMFSLVSALSIFFAVVPSLVLTEAIPNDSQYRVRDLLDSLPLGQGTYLLGKVGGTWAGVLGGLLFVFVATALLLRLIIGPFLLDGYALIWLVLLPLALFTSACAVLLAAGQPTRRRAIFVGALLMTYSLTSYAAPTEQAPTLGDLLRPLQVDSYMALQQIYLFNLIPPTLRAEILSGSPPAMPPFPLMLALQAAQLVLLGLLTWGWRVWRSGRQ